jgi:cell division protein FtsZ
MPDLVNTTPRIVVIGVGGAGGNAVTNMVAAGLTGVQFVAANTDTQALAASKAEHRIQLGSGLTDGLGAGSKPEIGEAAAEEALNEIISRISGAHMLFIAAGMGGGTGTGAAYVIARAAKELGILTIAVVTKPFQFEGTQRMRNADTGIAALRPYVDTLLIIPNENLFRIATDRTSFAEAFLVADQVLYSGITCLVDLIIKEGLINLDLADVKTVLSGMGTAMMGAGEAGGEQRATAAAEEAIVNPLLDDVTLKGAKSLLLSITGGRDLTLWDVDEAVNRVRQEVDTDANIIVGAILDESLGEKMRVSIVASGMPSPVHKEPSFAPEDKSWVPRSLTTLSSIPPGKDHFGRRLTDAISERTAQGKPRGGRRSNTKARAAPHDGATIREASPPKLSEHTAVEHAKTNTTTRRRTPTQAARPKVAPSSQYPEASERTVRPPALAAGHVGWPEHWAAASETQATARSAAIPTPLRPPSGQPTQRRASLLQRLANLVARSEP